MPNDTSQINTPTPPIDYSKATFNPQFQAKMLEIKNTIGQLRSQDISDDKIFSYLQQKGVLQMPEPPKVPDQDLGNRIGADFMDRGKRLVDEYGKTKEEVANAGGGAIPVIAGVAEMAGNVAGETSGAVINTGLEIGKQLINKINGDNGEKLAAAGDVFLNSTNVLGQKNSETLSHIGNFIKNGTDNLPPNVVKSFENFFNTIGLMGGGKLLNTPVEDIVTAAKNVPSEIIDMADIGRKKVISGSVGTPDIMTFQNRLNVAQNEIYGKFTPTEMANVPLKDVGVGPFKKSVPDLVSGGRTKSIIESVANLPEDIQIQKGDTLAIKDSKLSQGISRLHSGTDEHLADPLMKANTSFNSSRFDSYMKEKVLDPIKNELGIDSPEYKATEKAVQTAKIQLESYDASGVYRGRQSFDSVWEKENPLMFKKAKGMMGQLDPRASATVDAGRVVRTSMNDFAEDLLPENDPFRYRMREESNLIQAKDEMRTRNAGDIGKTKIEIGVQRFKKSNPVTTKIGEAGIKAAGLGALGAGLHLIP